jgi:peptide/nickel transport system substrate-binding protein
MKRNLRLLALPVVVPLALLAAGCSSGHSTSGSTSGGILRTGTDSTIDSLNPFVSFQATSTWVYTNNYPYLVNYDSNHNFIGEFATRWSQSKDGLTWTFHTVPNAKWSDGAPLNAQDAAWTLNTVLKYQNGPTSIMANQVAHLKSVSAPSANTLVLTYSDPVSNVLSQMIQIPILPAQQQWGKLATGNGKGLKTYPNTPQNGKPLVSGGPFMLSKYAKDQYAILTRNPHWYGKKPQIDGFGIQIFSDTDAMLTAFKNGQIDAITDVPFTAVKSIKQAGFKVNITPGNFFYDFILNSNPKKPQHRELLNLQVRKAFEYAIDRQHIIEVALLGYGQMGTTVVPPATGKWHDPNIEALPFNIGAANSILDNLGYKKGSNGIRIAGGHPMEYQVIVPSNRTSVLTPAFRIIQSDFRKIGVGLTEKVLDPNGAFEAILAPNNKYLDFDLSMWDWLPNTDPDYIMSVLLCNQYGSNSDSAYCNKKYDALYDKQGTAVDPQQRLNIIYQMQQMLYNDRPYIVLIYPDVVDAYTTKWTGFYNLPGSGIFGVNQSMINAHKAG